MREVDLPSPGFGSKSMHLRRIAANTITAVELGAARNVGGVGSEAAKLKAFFDACAAAALELTKIMPIMTLVTAGGAKTVAVGATLATTANKGGSAGVVTYTSSDPAVATVSASGVITGVAPGDVVILARMAGTATYRASSASVGVSVVSA